VTGFGAIAVDVAYGGMMYVIVSAIELGFTLERSEARSLVEVGERIKLAAAEQLPSVHPQSDPLCGTRNT
jgi:proline racemase